jgi:hypothetical protein
MTSADQTTYKLIIVEGTSDLKLLKAILSDMKIIDVTVKHTDGLAQFVDKGIQIINSIEEPWNVAQVLLIWDRDHHNPTSDSSKKKFFNKLFIDKSTMISHNEIISNAIIKGKEGISITYHLSLFEMPGEEVPDGKEMEDLWRQTLDPTMQSCIEQFFSCLPYEKPLKKIGKRYEHAALAIYPHDYYSSLSDGKPENENDKNTLFNVKHKAYKPLKVHIQSFFQHNP